jgi:hypothetical protein
MAKGFERRVAKLEQRTPTFLRFAELRARFEARYGSAGINGHGDFSEALCGSAPRHLGIRRAVLVHVTDARLGLHVDIWIRRIFAGDA